MPKLPCSLPYYTPFSTNTSVSTLSFSSSLRTYSCVSTCSSTSVVSALAIVHQYYHIPTNLITINHIRTYSTHARTNPSTIVSQNAPKSNILSILSTSIFTNNNVHVQPFSSSASSNERSSTESRGRQKRSRITKSTSASQKKSSITRKNTTNTNDDEDNKFVTISTEEAKQLGIYEELINDNTPLNPSSSSTTNTNTTTTLPSSSSTTNTTLTDIKYSSKYKGVVKEGKEAILWEAIIKVNDRDISGGEYETEIEAAKAYDALVRMYYGHLPNINELTNFPIDRNITWIPPEEIVTTGQIETKLGIPLTVEEITKALEQEKGLNIQVVYLKGKSDLAEALIFVTGRSIAHMRKMADLISRALRKRRLYGIDSTVEARDSDDWMLVDCGNIIVSFMDAETREVFALESFWNNMVEGKDPYENMTYDEWLEKNPIPEKWIKRLEKDELEFETEKRLLQAPPQEKDSFHFRSKLTKNNAKYGNKR